MGFAEVVVLLVFDGLIDCGLLVCSSYGRKIQHLAGKNGKRYKWE